MKGRILKEEDRYIIEFSREEKPEGKKRYILDKEMWALVLWNEDLMLSHEINFEIKNCIYEGEITECATFASTHPDTTLTKTTEYKRNSSEKIQNITDSLNRLIQAKNKNYGNSALSPLGVFNKNGSTEGIKVRLDDKLMRVKNSDILRKNDIADIMGYLVLLCVSEEWLNFDELID